MMECTKKVMRWMDYEGWLFNEWYARHGGCNLNPDKPKELQKAFKTWKKINKIDDKSIKIKRNK